MMKYDIFISYSHKDYEIVAHICKQLTLHNLTYFIDKSNIKIGNDFPDVIADAILNSRIFLFIASNNAYNSNFTSSELAFAHKHKSKDSIIPYIIDNSPLPKGLDLVLSSTDFKTTAKFSVEDLCQELSLRLRQKPIEIIHNFDTRKIAKSLYWIMFAIISYLICSASVNSLKFVVDSLSISLLWINVIGIILIFAVCIKYLYLSLVYNDVRRYLLGLLGAMCFGILMITPSTTHSLYLNFCLQTNIKSEYTLLYDYINSMPNDSIYCDTKNKFEKIGKQIQYGEIDVFEIEGSRLIRENFNEVYNYTKTFYKNNPLDINAQQYFSRGNSCIEDTYSIFKMWASQFKDGFKIEFTISMIISMIIAILFILIIKKL